MQVKSFAVIHGIGNPQAAAAGGDEHQSCERKLVARAADIVFLSSEPYPFREKHRQLLATQLPEVRCALIDGEMVSWYGSRAIAGLAYLRALRTRLGQR